MVLETAPPHYSVEEYFALEESSEYRSDVEDGIFNLASANCKIPHGQIYE